MATVKEPARKRARVRGRTVLAAVINGASLAEISDSKHISLKHAEKLLRDELRKRWIAPIGDYARLQIARLEVIAGQLKFNSNRTDLPTIDRLLKIMDRLDRYHGFTKLAPLASATSEDIVPKLLGKFDQAGRTPAREA